MTNEDIKNEGNEQSLEKDVQVDVTENNNGNSELITEEKVETVEPTESAESEVNTDEESNSETQNEELIQNSEEDPNKEVEEETKSDFNAPINEEALQNQMNEFDKLKNDIESFLASFAENEDLKLLGKNIVTYKEQLDAFFLLKSDIKDPVIEKLQETFDKVSEKREQLRQERNKVFDENLAKVKTEVETVLNEIPQIESFKQCRAKLVELQGIVKSAELRSNDKDNFFEIIQKAFDEINERQQAYREAYEMECSENYLKIKPYVVSTVEKAKNNERFNDSRKILIELQKKIKELTLSKNQRDELYQTIRDVFNEINEKQDKDREKFVSESKENYEKAKPLVEDAIKKATDPENINNSRNILIDAQKQLKDLTLTKEQRDELFGAIREVFNKLNEQSDENREEFEDEANANFSKLEVKVNEAIMNVDYSNDFKDIREGLIACQDEIKMVKLKRNQRNDLLSRIRKAFEKFDEKRDKFYSKKREDKIGKLNSIVDNLNEKIQRLEETNTSDNESISQLESQLNDATDEQKNELESSINSMKEKVESRNISIKESRDRIEDINKDLAGLNEKK